MMMSPPTASSFEPVGHGQVGGPSSSNTPLTVLSLRGLSMEDSMLEHQLQFKPPAVSALLAAPAWCPIQPNHPKAGPVLYIEISNTWEMLCAEVSVFGEISREVARNSSS